MTKVEREELKQTKAKFKKSVKNGTDPGRNELIAQVATFPVDKLRANWVFGSLNLN
jgi:hypothetical protein